jgi:hypothetical protein
MNTSGHEQRKVHSAKVVSSDITDLRLRKILQPPFQSGHLCIGLLPFWLKGKLQQQQFTNPDWRFEAVNKIFTALSVDIIEEVVRNWIRRLEKVIALNDDYI